MKNHAVRTRSITVGVPLSAAYEFVQRPENFPQWAAGMSDSLHKTSSGWVAKTPIGDALVRFSEPNPYGVLDHWVRLEGRPEIYIPLRMVANGGGTEVELMLFRQPDMSDADFERDTGMVEKDLATLKRVLERL